MVSMRMHGILRTAALAAVTGGALLSPQEARDAITAERLRAHLIFLSHDLVEGRAPGTRGGELAAEYIASEMRGMGLEPVAGSFFQPVPMLGMTVEPESVRLEFDAGRNGRPTPGTRSDSGPAEPLFALYPAETVVWPGAPRRELQVDGELVFVGYGVRAPEWSWDDYKGTDVTGKVALILVGDPPASPDEPGLFRGRALTYYGRWTYKLEEARRRGAAGALLVHRTDAAGYDWGVVATSWTGEQFTLPDRPSGPLLNGWVSDPLARELLSRGGLDLDELYVRAARRDFRPLRTGITVRSRMVSRSRRVETRNVVGVIRGTDPGRARQVVVFTSHYDHLGIGTPDATGDSVYNGAYDNASGVSVLLEVARALERVEGGPARTLLFIATAAEEAGMLGSEHYVDRPLFPLARTVAAINLDGASLWGETEDVIGLGADLSSLGEVLERHARESGLELRPDPAPQTGAFFRSDQFPFARAGVPVLYIEHGLSFRNRPPGWGEELMNRYMRDRYHQPGDEYRPELDLSGAVQQARLVFDVGLDIANAEEPPAWNPGSPFAAARSRASTAPRPRLRR